jgi:hypothetical protein
MSVLLQGRNGNEFEIGFIVDSYPEVQDGTGDSSWITVSFRVATPEQSWEESSPCLNLFEFSTLADWLDAVAAAPAEQTATEPDAVELLEPELRFSVAGQTKDAVTLHIGFHLDNRPEEFQVDAATDEMEAIDIHVTRPQVKAAAAILRETLRELESSNEKDDIIAEASSGLMGAPDDDLNIVDDLKDEPPGAGFGEDNAGER